MNTTEEQLRELPVLGWYCDHRDEQPGPSSHIGLMPVRVGAGVEYQHRPGPVTWRSITFNRGPCPRAVPLVAAL